MIMVVTFLVSLGCLAAGLFSIGPYLQNSVSPEVANTFYILLRVLVIGLFSFLAVYKYNKKTIHALSFTGLLIFADQVGLKSIYFLTQFKTHPADWEGVTPSAVLFNNAFSYIVFLPLILLIAFLGSALAMYLKQKRDTRAA
jgi:hypothetical protein